MRADRFFAMVKHARGLRYRERMSHTYDLCLISYLSNAADFNDVEKFAQFYWDRSLSDTDRFDLDRQRQRVEALATQMTPQVDISQESGGQTVLDLFRYAKERGVYG